MLRNTYIKNGRLDLSNPSFTDEQHYQERIRRAVPTPGDLVISREAPMGEIAMIPERVRACLGQRLVLLRTKSDACDARFLLYSFLGGHLRDQVRMHEGTGSTVSNLRIPHLKSLSLPIPPLKEQRSIAAVLGSLDDKIELNRQMNRTLEELARAIFKSWFVDFDPVHAKAAGQQPIGMDAETAALFPDSFQDSPLGPIPTGWGIEILGTLLDVERGLSYKGDWLADGGMPMLNLGSFLGHGRYEPSALKYYQGDYKSHHKVSPGDLLLANTDITQKREVIGSPILVPPGDHEEYLFSHHVFAARFVDGYEAWKEFVYFLLLQPRFRGRAMGYATGTTVLALPKDAVLDTRFAMPQACLNDALKELLGPMMERRWLNDSENKLLVEIRDFLLPRLLSGEVRVPVGELSPTGSK